MVLLKQIQSGAWDVAVSFSSGVEAWRDKDNFYSTVEAAEASGVEAGHRLLDARKAKP